MEIIRIYTDGLSPEIKALLCEYACADHILYYDSNNSEAKIRRGLATERLEAQRFYPYYDDLEECYRAR